MYLTELYYIVNAIIVTHFSEKLTSSINRPHSHSHYLVYNFMDSYIITSAYVKLNKDTQDIRQHS
jgi:hypothetical protein